MTALHAVDINILVASAQADHPRRSLAVGACDGVRHRGFTLCVALQNVIEFWAVATRPATAQGGLGMTPAEATQELDAIETMYEFILDRADVYSAWRDLVTKHGVSGVRTHDARLAATMLANGVDHILTFDTADFAGFPEIVAVHPKDVIPA